MNPQKTRIWLISVLFFLISSNILYAQQKPSIEEQILILNNQVKMFDNLINNIDNIIELYQQQKRDLIENRANINALRDILQSSKTVKSKSSNEFVLASATGEAAESAAIVIGAGAIGGPAAAAVGAAIEVNRKLDKAIQEVEKQNDRIEQNLKKQKEDICKEQGLYCE